MKTKILFPVLFFIISSFSSVAQVKDSLAINKKRDSLLLIKKKDSLDKIKYYNEVLLERRKRDSIKNIRLKKSIKDKEKFGKYKLYPTSNMYNFIELNTSNGYINLVQWSLESNQRFKYGYISTAYYDLLKSEGIDSSWDDYERPIGRFELYPTSNKWTFILLDNFKGTTWQVQWSFEENERFAKKIR